MLTQIVVGVVCLFVGALLSFTVTILTTRNIQKSIAKEITLVHEQVHHREPIDVVIDKHVSECLPVQDHNSVKTSLIFLVKEAGGN